MKINNIFVKIFVLTIVYLLGMMSHLYYDKKHNHDSLIINNHDTLKLNFEKGGVDIRNYLALKKERSVVGVAKKKVSFYYKKTDDNEVCLYFFDNGIIEKIKNFKDSGNNSFINFHQSEEFLIDRDLTQCLSISGLQKVYKKDSIYDFNIYLIGEKTAKSKLFVNSNSNNYSYTIINDNTGKNEVTMKLKFNKVGYSSIRGTYVGYNYLNPKTDSSMSSLILPFNINFSVK